MMTERVQSNVLALLQWQKQSVVLYAAMGLLAYVLWLFFAWEESPLPPLPMAVVGGAIGIFVSFRTNSAYDRWWEGRKLWGRLINTTRFFGTQASTYPTDVALRRTLIHRQIAYVHVLRCSLRLQDPLQDRDALEWLTEEEQELVLRSGNPCHALLQRHQMDLVKLNDSGKLSDFRLQSMDTTIIDLLNIQGGCERIKKTPIPRGYGFISEILVRYYSMILPFAMIAELGIFTIPMNILVCLAFALISEAGRVLEDPFNLFFNGLPLYAISRMLENNLRNVMGEYDDLKPMMKADAIGVLM